MLDRDWLPRWHGFNPSIAPTVSQGQPRLLAGPIRSFPTGTPKHPSTQGIAHRRHRWPTATRQHRQPKPRYGHRRRVQREEPLRAPATAKSTSLTLEAGDLTRHTSRADVGGVVALMIAYRRQRDLEQFQGLLHVSAPQPPNSAQLMSPSASDWGRELFDASRTECERLAATCLQLSTDVSYRGGKVVARTSLAYAKMPRPRLRRTPATA